MSRLAPWLAHPRARFVTSLLLAFVLGSVGVPATGHGQGADKPRAGTGQVRVSVTGFRNERGKVFIALWRGEKDFPGTPPAGSPTASVSIVKGLAQASFADVKPGVFAVTVFHDEDGNGKMKKSFIGIPKEGIGFSRDGRGRFGPPGWDDCKLTLDPGEIEQVKITMLYY
jgi:uncharacterized protein (DUF2141 family)